MTQPDSFDEIVPRLVAEWKVPAAGAALLASKLRAAVPEIQAAFWGWWNSGALPTISAAGVDLQTLIDRHGMSPIAAFLTLDWLLREPEAALRSLSKGHDQVRSRGG